MLSNHSVTPAAGEQMTDPGRPGSEVVSPEVDAFDAYAGGYKDPEVVNRWIEWESD